jgi:hypothetical protein
VRFFERFGDAAMEQLHGAIAREENVATLVAGFRTYGDWSWSGKTFILGF